MEVDYNGYNRGAYYAAFIGDSYRNYYNGISYKNDLYAIGLNKVSKLPAYNFNGTTQKLTNPDLSSATGRTLGTGWTTTDAGAKHTTGNTGTLVSDAIMGYTIDDQFRVAFKVTGRTAGTINVKETDALNITFNSHADGRYTVTVRGSTSGLTLTFTPSSAFDGTIERVEVYTIALSSYTEINLTYDLPRGSTYYRPALVREGDLYIGAGSYVNIINLADNGVVAKQLVDASFTIVAMNQQAGNIIIWATDGYDSRQYYWNGVDAVATEVIEWK